MKFIFSVMILLFVLQNSFGQDVTYTITGHRQLYEGVDTFLLAEIHLHSNEGFKLGSGQFYLNYNTMAFGQNIFSNNKINFSTPDGTIIDYSINAPPFNFSYYNNIIINDNTSSRVSVSWQHAFSKGCLQNSNVTNYADLLFGVKIKYLPNMTQVPHLVCLESGSSFIHQTFTACGPNPCNINDCLNFPGIQLLTDQYTCYDCKFVSVTNDSGLGSLRDAIGCAENGDTIRFAYSLFADSIALTTQTLIIDKDIRILAKKHFNITLDGSEVMRVFGINTGKNVEISGLKLIEGNGVEGTGILNEGNLILKDITVYKRQNSTSLSQVLNNAVMQIEDDVSIKNP